MTTFRSGSSFPALCPSTPAQTICPTFGGTLTSAGVGADLVTDAHLASIAMEYQAELHSNDVDFSRFPGLRWRNPI